MQVVLATHFSVVRSAWSCSESTLGRHVSFEAAAAPEASDSNVAAVVLENFMAAVCERQLKMKSCGQERRSDAAYAGGSLHSYLISRRHRPSRSD